MTPKPNPTPQPEPTRVPMLTLQKKLRPTLNRVLYQGETLIVTDYGQPIAIISPIPNNTTEQDSE